MSLHRVNVGTLTIANGATDSPALSTLLTAGQMKVLGGSIADLEITAPAALTGTCNVQTVPVEGSTTWTDATLFGSTFALGAGTTTSIPISSFADLRIHSGSAEGAARAFIVVAQLATM